MLKSRLQKLNGLKYENLKEYIQKVKIKYRKINMTMYLRVLIKDQINMFQK